MSRRALSTTGELLEEPFQTQVIQLAGFYGWRVAHFRPAKTAKGYRTAVSADGAGFPDLVLVRPPELLFVELKTDKGRVGPAQKEWLDALEVVGEAARLAAHAHGQYDSGPGDPPAVEVHVWRPRDFDELHARLARGRCRQEPVRS